MTTAAETPKLRFHKPSGQYLVALPTKDGKPKYVYLGRDERAAQLRYDALVVGMAPMAPQPAPTVPTAPKVNFKATVTVRQAAAALVEYNVSQHPNRAQRTRLWSNVCLKPIVSKYGDNPIGFLETDHLEELQRELAKTLANKTVNDYVGMTKRMEKYAAFKKWRAPMETSQPPKNQPIKSFHRSAKTFGAKKKRAQRGDHRLHTRYFQPLCRICGGSARSIEICRLRKAIFAAKSRVSAVWRRQT